MEDHCLSTVTKSEPNSSTDTSQRMLRKFRSIANSFSFANLRSIHWDFLSNNTAFLLKYQCGRIHLSYNSTLQAWKSTNKISLNKQAKFNKKLVFFVSETSQVLEIHLNPHSQCLCTDCTSSDRHIIRQTRDGFHV